MLEDASIVDLVSVAELVIGVSVTFPLVENASKEVLKSSDTIFAVVGVRGVA